MLEVDLAGIARDTGSVLLRLAAYMGVAFVLEAVISRYVPQGIVAGALGRDTPWAVPLATLIGGAVTTIPAMSAVWGIVKPRVFGLYLAFCAGGALLAGFGFQLIQAVTGR